MKLALCRPWIVFPIRIQVRIAGLAELSPSTETEIEWQLVRLAQLTSILNRCEGIPGIVISHKAIVVPMVSKVQGTFFNLAKIGEALL